MSTIQRILNAIHRIARGELFSTRRFLSLGSRGAVDQALYCLVKQGAIIRVARGLFLKRGSGQPCVLAVARAKAEAFGRRIFQHGADAAHALGLGGEANHSPTFAINGRSSSFRFGRTVIRFVSVSPRKQVGDDSLLGQVVRAMWHLGRERFTDGVIARSYPRWSSACLLLEQSAPLLPHWINSKFYWARPDTRNTEQYGYLPAPAGDLSELLPEYADLFDSLEAKYPKRP